MLIGRRLGDSSRDRCLLGWRYDHIWCVYDMLRMFALNNIVFAYNIFKCGNDVEQDDGMRQN